MSERIGIKKTILLTDCSESHSYIGEYTILKKMPRDGASALCYQAKNPMGTKGVLKEFYPTDVESLIRNNHDQLVNVDGVDEETEKYYSLLEEYLEPYRMLCKARENNDLATVIPPYEILYGCNEDGKAVGTAYIWSPIPAYYSFEEVIHEIHSSPSDRPEYKITQILYSLESLVKSINILHSAGLVHRDINPANFGFRKLGKDVLTQTISLFDVDTVCSVYRVPEVAKGTEGFLEPECVNCKANNLTDIFAIGATLFQAIVITKETKKNGCRYDYSYFSRLQELIGDSELLLAAEMNIHPGFKDILLRILQKTLCLRDERYHNCEELLEDIKTALYYIVPMEISDKGEAGKQWILADVEKYYSKSNERNITLAIQHHLYVHPLYMNFDDQENSKETFELLIVGFDMCGQKFLDQALQISQMLKQHLKVNIVLDNVEDKKQYLSKRPELHNFFDIGASVSDDKESYGTLSFVEHTFSISDSEKNNQYISQLYNDTAPDYIYISTGKDKHNLIIAQSLNTQSTICINWSAKKHISLKKLNGIIPVYVSDDILKLPLIREIERMAFNVHLIWNNNLNVKFQDVRKDYLKPYNRYSCVSFVIAMKYRLHNVGIEMDQIGVKQAAREFQSNILQNASQKNDWIYSEHRRWVSEKVCLGYRATTDLEYCATGLMKDEKKKRHVCLVRSTPEMSLRSKEWFNISQRQPITDKWDNPSAQALDSLDELDRMSVKLHMMFLKHAKLEQEHNLLNGQLVSELRSQIESDNDCVIAWQELFTCMKDIWDNDVNQCKRYEGLTKRFLNMVKNSNCMNERNKASINKLWDSLHERFYPIFESRQYRDYKMYDVKLVEGIPFILTYSESIYMAIPYTTGTNDDEFSNLAAATVVNPSVIIYFTYCSSIKEIENIKKTLPHIFSYMKKKEFRAKVEFIIGYEENSREESTAKIEQSMVELSKGRLKRVKLMRAQSPKEFVAMLTEYLTVRSRKKQNFLVEYNGTSLASRLDENGFYNHFSSYAYYPESMSFKVIHDADIVSYIKKEPYITVTDMFSLKKASSETSNKPEFFADYKKIWQIYRTQTVAWKNVCRELSCYVEQNDKVVFFNRNSREHEEKEYRYIIPFNCKKATKKILAALIGERIISDSSYVRTLTTSSCEVMIRDLMENQTPYDILFSKAYMLMEEEYLRCDVDSEHHVVKIYYDNLIVANMDSSAFGKQEYDLIEYLGGNEIRYLTNLHIDRSAKKIWFAFATKQIKNMLTIEGRFLEIYVYSKAYETGSFDDIRSSFEIDWNDHLAKNEIDCILCKGFSSLLVECKATRKLKRDFYDKLSVLVRNFGINAKAVIVADTVDTPETKAENDRLRAYGEKQGIITISDRTNIGNIGMVLLGLVKK